MRFKYLFSFTVLFVAVSTSYASREGVQTFPATENDGTPTHIRNSTPLTKEPSVYLEDVVPAPKKRMAEREEAKKEIPQAAQAPTLTEADIQKEQDAILDGEQPVTAEKRIQEQQAVATQVRTEEAKKAEIQLQKDHYDVVPKQRESEVAARMKYTYEILRRYGRAYDYRVLTSRELKGLLTQLEQQRD